MRAGFKKFVQSLACLRDRIRPRDADGIETLRKRRCDELGFQCVGRQKSRLA
jgi:hypothetical protein